MPTGLTIDCNLRTRVCRRRRRKPFASISNAACCSRQAKGDDCAAASTEVTSRKSRRTRKKHLWPWAGRNFDCQPWETSKTKNFVDGKHFAHKWSNSCCKVGKEKPTGRRVPQQSL